MATVGGGGAAIALVPAGAVLTHDVQAISAYGVRRRIVGAEAG